jgi:hypothetical protein
MKIRPGCFLLALSILAGGAPAQTDGAHRPLSAFARAHIDKMTPIFNGKTLDGWVTTTNAWTVKESAMASLGAGRGVIYTRREYGNYRLIFTMRHVSGQPDHQACVLIFGQTTAGPENVPDSVINDRIKEETRKEFGDREALIKHLQSQGSTFEAYRERKRREIIAEGKPFTLDALGAIQFQPPTSSGWDYRPGHNNAGKQYFVRYPHAAFDSHQWSQVELLVHTNGTARMAVAQPVGTRAIEVSRFNDLTAGRIGPIAWQMHNKGLFDEYKDVRIEENPEDRLITTE